MMDLDYNLLQPHTIELYRLKECPCTVQRVHATSLLVPQRFDLFAKLFYIDNIQSNPIRAKQVYQEHIRAFNPDGREPGRADKNGVDDFTESFDRIIAHFRVHDFDERISVVPVDKHGVILDGAHRVAALAYFGRDITIAKFSDVEAVCTFDFNYFKNRGLSWAIGDTIALELVKWIKGIYAACIWPSNTQENQQLAINKLSQDYPIAFIKSIRCDLSSLSHFVGHIYRTQEWTRNDEYVLDKASRIYGMSNLLVAFFKAPTDLDLILDEKEKIRQLLGKGKDSIHITDNESETLDLARAVLTPDGLNQWMSARNRSLFHRLMDTIRERWFVFKKVQWVAFKVKVYNSRLSRLLTKHAVL